MLTSKPHLLIFDNGVLRNSEMLDSIEMFLKEHNISGIPDISITEIGMIEWLGFPWVSFLKNYSAQSTVQTIWTSLHSLSVLDERDRSQASKELREYFNSFRSTKLLKDLSQSIIKRFKEQHSGSSFSPSQQHVSQIIEEEILDGATVKEEHLTRIVTLLAAQILFAPTTIGITECIIRNQKAEEWKDFFICQCIQNRIDQTENELAYLWTTYTKNMPLKTGQALDIEMYDMLFFGSDNYGHIAPVHVFTAEGHNAFESRLSETAKTLLRIAGDLVRSNGTPVPVVFGKVSCFNDGKWKEITVKNIFLSNSKQLNSKN